MEPEFERDMQDILNELDAAEVVTIILPLLGRCLVLDGRATQEDPPHLSVVPQAGSAERRLQQVNSARPHQAQGYALAGSFFDSSTMRGVRWPGTSA